VTYDAAGNLTADGTGYGTHTFQWDAEGRMVSVDGGAGQSCQSSWTDCFTYNALGQRVKKHVGSPASDTYYYYDASGNLAMAKGASHVNEYLFPGNFGKYYWTGSAWETDYTHKNLVGSTQVVTRANGSYAQAQNFYSFGGVRWYAGGTQDLRSSVVGNLGWNQNGTLNQLTIADPFVSADQQTCNYGYDDLARINNANCGSIWNETFHFDTTNVTGAFGNVNKHAISGATGFEPTYDLSTNRISSLGSQSFGYDANGNLTSTGNGTGTNSYAWDSDGNMVGDTANGVGAVTATYDALGRMVERGSGSSYTQSVYAPIGLKLSLMSGQSLSEARVPLAAGAWARYNSSGLSAYWHTDWQGNLRLSSTPSRTVATDIAYGPYGEMYVSSGVEPFYGGMFNDTSTELYDAVFREHNPGQGRWISPDPAGLAAVDPTNPQSWNRYAYAMNNPLIFTDPMGLDTCNATNLFNGSWEGNGNPPWTDYPCLQPEPDAPPIWDPFGAFIDGGGGWGGGGVFNSPFSWNDPCGPPDDRSPNCISGGPLWWAMFSFPMVGWIYATATAQMPPSPSPKSIPLVPIPPPACSDVLSLGGNGYKVTTQFMQGGHAGMDFSAPSGTPIRINFAGTISPWTGAHRGFGNAIVVFSKGRFWLFGHGPTASGITAGMNVPAGTIIGTVGSMGRSTGPHVHVQTSSVNIWNGPWSRPCVP